MSEKYKFIIDPNTNTMTNTETKKKYKITSGDFSSKCHKIKFYTPCGECKVIKKSKTSWQYMAPATIRLNFKQMPCVSNANVSKYPYMIHGYGTGPHRKKIIDRIKKYNGYITRGCIGLNDKDILEIHDLLNIGDKIFIKSYTNKNLEAYVKKYTKT